MSTVSVVPVTVPMDGAVHHVRDVSRHFSVAGVFSYIRRLRNEMKCMYQHTVVVV